MENVTHLWNITKFLSKHKNPQANELRNYYVQCCKELTSDGELPKQIFGTNTMCSYCGSLWNTVDYKVRLIRGKPIPNSVKKLIKNSNNNLQLSMYQSRLVRKCMKNRLNKLLIICSNCKKKNKVTLNKPDRLKIVRSENMTDKTPKKKKKRIRDKTAGLLINTPNVKDDQRVGIKKNDIDTPKLLNSKEKYKRSNNINNANASGSKPKKINISKLKGIINTSITPSRRSSLHNFLTELG
ncbi:uncharacterized protein LOC103573232 [Microplitis demolitor]|uniref:uncharacterized protein LOC103573232 n=1 Tax=Microplitis demolitor TaxID=69319 RepID=UPI0004CC9D7B|nr:uncharacterized protein LOC103573232 [Microplitis demolitor]